jgi:hypothetical protein
LPSGFFRSANESASLRFAPFLLTTSDNTLLLPRFTVTHMALISFAKEFNASLPKQLAQ